MLLGCRVVDVSTEFGWLTGRMLGELGADVVRVELPGTDVTGVAYRAYHAGKRGVCLDWESGEGLRALRRLVARSEVFLEGLTLAQAREKGLTYDELAAGNPGLVQVSVSAYGPTGPRSSWKASDLEVMAAGGAMSLAGDPGGEPLRVSQPQAPMWAGAEAAVGALLALTERQVSGRGQYVDVSAQAAVLSALSHAPAFWSINEELQTRSGAHLTGRSVTGARFRVFWPCRDGEINFILYGGEAGRRTNRQLTAWMREAGMPSAVLEATDWTRFDPTRSTQAEIDALEEPIAAFLATRTKAEFLDEAAKRDMLGYPVFNVADIQADPQLEARGLWEELPEGEALARHVGGFARFDGERPRIGRAAPALGEHTVEVLAEAGFATSEIADLLTREVAR